jgi:serine/threonine protein kinase
MQILSEGWGWGDHTQDDVISMTMRRKNERRGETGKTAAVGPGAMSLQNYRLMEKMGEGTFSEVLKCQSMLDGKLYACKKMKHRYRRYNTSSATSPVYHFLQLLTMRLCLPLAGSR